MTKKKPRKKKCRQCRTRFTPRNSLQTTCSWPCALAEARAQHAKQEKRERKRRLEELKPKRDLLREAQREFNAWIRERDKHLPCISCGETNPPETSGGQWDCGHYKTVGAFPELRFEERNAHKQCKRCNAGSGRFGRKGRTVTAEYRERLIARIGLEAVEWLEGPHDPKHYTHDELREIRDTFRARVREMRRAA